MGDVVCELTLTVGTATHLRHTAADCWKGNAKPCPPEMPVATQHTHTHTHHRTRTRTRTRTRMKARLSRCYDNGAGASKRYQRC
jgi:hypothetical protein